MQTLIVSLLKSTLIFLEPNLRGGPALSPTPPPACSHRELILPLKEMFESYAAAKKAIDLIQLLGAQQ